MVLYIVPKTLYSLGVLMFREIKSCNHLSEEIGKFWRKQRANKISYIVFSSGHIFEIERGIKGKKASHHSKGI